MGGVIAAVAFIREVQELDRPGREKHRLTQEGGHDVPPVFEQLSGSGEPYQPRDDKDDDRDIDDEYLEARQLERQVHPVLQRLCRRQDDLVEAAQQGPGQAADVAKADDEAQGREQRQDGLEFLRQQTLKQRLLRRFIALIDCLAVHLIGSYGIKPLVAPGGVTRHFMSQLDLSK